VIGPIPRLCHYRVSATTRKSLKCKHSEVSNDRHQYIAEQGAHVPGALQGLHALRDRDARPVTCSVGFDGASVTVNSLSQRHRWVALGRGWGGGWQPGDPCPPQRSGTHGLAAPADPRLPAALRLTPQGGPWLPEPSQGADLCSGRHPRAARDQDRHPCERPPRPNARVQLPAARPALAPRMDRMRGRSTATPRSAATTAPGSAWVSTHTGSWYGVPGPVP
jgi:hypothetical protein